MSGGKSATNITPAKEDLALDQPKEAVEMKKMENTDGEQRQSQDGPSLPVPAKDDDTSASLKESEKSATVRSAKGKEKEESRTPAEKQRDEDALSIGPTDTPDDESKNGSDAPVCNITLLLATGKRHPFRIDEKYLAKRSVDIPDVTESGQKDPLSISVYKLKELILREWRDEWEDKPTSPSSIRLIFFGHQLEDKEQLKSKHCPSKRRSDARFEEFV